MIESIIYIVCTLAGAASVVFFVALLTALIVDYGFKLWEKWRNKA